PPQCQPHRWLVADADHRGRHDRCQRAANERSAVSVIAVVGLATMGMNLARNLARNGFGVSVYNRTTSRVDDFMKQYGSEGAFTPAHTPEELVSQLEKPRRILIMVKAGPPVDDTPCCTHIGPGGAGHYVKMVHNGIEYADIQLIAEAYDLLSHALELGAEDLSRIFAEWNKGDLESYLIQITSEVLAKRDPATGRPLVDVILDEAAQKGTGKWASQSALDLGIPVTAITEAVFARFLSALKADRQVASRTLAGPNGAMRAPAR